MKQTRGFVDKLGLRAGQSVCLLDAPPDFKVLGFSDEEYGIRFVVRRTERGQRP